MEDLGEARENFVEFFRCVECPGTLLSPSPTSFPPSSHGNLLAASSKFGFLFVAFGNELLVFQLDSLREKGPSAKPQFKVSLAAEGTCSGRALSLLLDDTVLLVHAEKAAGKKDEVLLFDVASLARGKAVRLPGPELKEGVKAFSVCPFFPEGNAQAAPKPQRIGFLLENGSVTLHVLSEDGTVPGGRPITESRLASDTPTCLALSPGEELLAVGTERGDVGIFDVESCLRRTTIIVVESGWIPFAIHFPTSSALLVSYACEDMVSHVVWTISESEGVLNAKRSSPLGELCFASPPSLPPSEDGEPGNAEWSGSDLLPVIFGSSIPGWDVYVVSSSLSSDVEVIAPNDDGVWENWKFDEGKSATLPTDKEDRDTRPIGIAMDLTDASMLPSADPTAPRINPMPRLLTMTSDFLLLPFQLVDDRPGAGCDFIRKPILLPPMGKMYRRIGKVPGPQQLPSSAQKPFDNAKRELNVEENGGRLEDPSLLENSLGGLAVCTISNGDSSLEEDRKPFQSNGQSFSKFSAAIDHGQQQLPPTRSFGKIRSRDSSDSDASGSTSEGESNEGDESEVSGSDAPTSEKGSSHHALGGGFSSAEMFLSHFVEDHEKRGERSEMVDRPAVGLQKWPVARTSEATRNKEADLTLNAVSSTSGLRYPPQPSYVDASIAVDAGLPINCVRSVLLEIRAEVNYNGNMEHVTKQRIRAIGAVITSRVACATAAIAESLAQVRKFFHDEAERRKEVLKSLKEVMWLNREYESVSLEFRVREVEGSTRTSTIGEKASDVQMTKKEEEILKCISSIDERLSTDRIEKRTLTNRSEQIQQIYSSLSLQGIRIRKVRNLLVALCHRMGELDKGGRRTSLGLSMARLEKLSITPAKAQVAAGSGHVRSMDMNAIDEKVSSEYDGQPQSSEHCSLASPDVRRVLRRLAMRGGRANICTTSARFAKDAGLGNADTGSRSLELSLPDEPEINGSAKADIGTMRKTSSKARTAVGNEHGQVRSEQQEALPAAPLPVAPAGNVVDVHTTGRSMVSGSFSSSRVKKKPLPIGTTLSARHEEEQFGLEAAASSHVGRGIEQSGGTGMGDALQEVPPRTEADRICLKPATAVVAPKTAVSAPAESATDPQPFNASRLFAALPPVGDDSAENRAQTKQAAPRVLPQEVLSSESGVTTSGNVQAENSPAPQRGVLSDKVTAYGVGSASLLASGARSEDNENMNKVVEPISLFGLSNGQTRTASSPSIPPALLQANTSSVAALTASSHGSSTEDSDLEVSNRLRSQTGMESGMEMSSAGNSFGVGLASSDETGMFGVQSNTANREPPGVAFTMPSSSAAFGGATAGGSPFGISGQSALQNSGFATPSFQPVSTSPFAAFATSSSFAHSTSAGFSSPLSAAAQIDSVSSLGGGGAQFGTPSQLGASHFGATTNMGIGSQFGATSQLGGGAQFGAPSQIGAGFGVSAQRGAAFGTPAESSSGGLGSGLGGFGGAAPTPKFGESNFGKRQEQGSFGAPGTAFGRNASSPFGSMTGPGFGGQTNATSGFAAIAASQSQAFGTPPTGFGAAAAPVFGTNNGPPAFTSAAFAQRRA